MVAYYQHDISAWMDGTEGLSDGEYRAYHVVCELMYLNNGPIVANERGFAGRCNQHVLAFRRNFASLVDKGKLTVAGDGKVTNRRVEAELRRISARRKPPSDPPPTPGEPPPGRAAKPLERKAPSRRKEEKERESLFPDGNRPPPAPEVEDERTRLWRGGLATLEKITGRRPGQLRALVGKWLRAMDDDCVGLRRVIEDAEINRIGEPIPWIERAVAARRRRGAGGASAGGGGFAAVFEEMREANMRQEDHHDDRDDAEPEPPRLLPAPRR